MLFAFNFDKDLCCWGVHAVQVHDAAVAFVWGVWRKDTEVRAVAFLFASDGVVAVGTHCVVIC